MGTTTIHIANNNAFFLTRTVDREPTAGEVAEALPGRRRRCVNQETSTITDAEQLLDLLGAVLKEQRPLKRSPNFPTFGPSTSGGLDACPGKITIDRLDDGFCITHTKPISKTALTKLARREGDEWKPVPEWLNLALGMFGDHLTKGPKRVLGFKTAEEVVSYVRVQIIEQ